MGQLSVIDLSLVADYKPNPNPPIRFQPYIGDIVRKGLCEVLWELCCNRRYDSTVCMCMSLMRKDCSKILGYVVKRKESHSGFVPARACSLFLLFSPFIVCRWVCIVGLGINDRG